MKKGKKFILYIFIFVCACLCMFSGYKIINYLKNNHENKNIKEKTNSLVKKKDDNEYKIDFKKLKKENPDTIAYLKVNGTNIDYVVVKGTDNKYYLHHNFNRNENISGWIFADYKNKFDGSDKNIVIYGHSTKDGSMFGTLSNVLDEKWQSNEDNLKILFVTEAGTFYYNVFSTYIITPEDYYINTKFNDTEEFNQFLNKIYYRSNHNYGTPISSEGQVLTLSSCNISGSKRIVLHAILENN